MDPGRGKRGDGGNNGGHMGVTRRVGITCEELNSWKCTFISPILNILVSAIRS
jgi:hypothetical protein